MGAHSIVERLRDEATTLHGLSFDCQGCGISSNLATEAADTIEECLTVLEWISYHADNQDMSHRDFRVDAGLKARTAIAKSQAPISVNTGSAQ